MRFLVLLFMLLQGQWLLSQTIHDAVLFGQYQNLGNARFVGMSGSFGALGGNASGASINAGGIGVYRKGEAGASLSVISQGYQSQHYGTNASASQLSGRLGHLSVVFSNELPDNDWKKFNLMLAYNRRNNFDEDIYATGTNTQSSKLDRYMLDILESGVFVEDIYDYFPFGAALAWDILLIDTLNGNYYHALESYGHTQEMKLSRRGGVSELFVGGGANYGDKLYVGAKLGLTTLNYNENSTYTERSLSGNDNTYVEYWSEGATVDLNGRGINVSLGFIYWFTEKIRAGMAFNGGHNYRISERYNKGMQATWKDRDQTTTASPNSYNEYRLKSPHSLVFSGALVDKYVGSINTDIELWTYGRMRYGNSSGFPVDFGPANQEMEDDLKAAFNFKLGGELLIGPVILRGGGALFGNPRKTGAAFNRMGLSGGLGLRIKRVNFDMAYSYLKSQPFERDIHFAQDIPLQPTTLNLESHQLVFTLTFRFKKMTYY